MARAAGNAKQKPRAAAKKRGAAIATKAPKKAPRPRKDPFADSKITQEDVEQTVVRGVRVRSEIRLAITSAEGFAPENTVLNPENIKNRKNLLKNKRELRVIHNYTMWKSEKSANGKTVATLQAPVPIPGENLGAFSIKGFVASLNGPYRYCAMAGELYVDYPLRHRVSMEIKAGSIQSIGLETSDMFRDSNRSYLAVTTKKYIYFLLTPARCFDSDWMTALILWERYTGQTDLYIGTLDYRIERPDWWHGLRSWIRFKKWKQRYYANSLIHAPRPEDKRGDQPRSNDVDDAGDEEYADSETDSEAGADVSSGSDMSGGEGEEEIQREQAGGQDQGDQPHLESQQRPAACDATQSNIGPPQLGPQLEEHGGRPFEDATQGAEASQQGEQDLFGLIQFRLLLDGGPQPPEVSQGSHSNVGEASGGGLQLEMPVCQAQQPLDATSSGAENAAPDRCHENAMNDFTSLLQQSASQDNQGAGGNVMSQLGNPQLASQQPLDLANNAMMEWEELDERLMSYAPLGDEYEGAFDVNIDIDSLLSGESIPPYKPGAPVVPESV